MDETSRDGQIKAGVNFQPRLPSEGRVSHMHEMTALGVGALRLLCPNTNGNLSLHKSGSPGGEGGISSSTHVKVPDRGRAYWTDKRQINDRKAYNFI